MTAVAESMPQPDPAGMSYVTEIDYSPSPAGGVLHRLFLPMREPEPLPEQVLEFEPEAGL